MPIDITSILQEYVATANNPKYNSDWNVINSKFPELKGYDPGLLQEYVSTANNEEYNSDWNIINSKFPELFSQKKKPLPYGSEISTSPLDIAKEITTPTKTFEFGTQNTQKQPEYKPIIGVDPTAQQPVKAVAYEADIPQELLPKKVEQKPSNKNVQQAYELSSAGDYEQSNAVIEKEISADPNNTYLLELQSLNLNNQAATLFSQGNFEDAKSLLLKSKQNIDAANALSKQQGKPLNISTYVAGANLSLVAGDKKTAKDFAQSAMYAYNGYLTDDQTDIQIAKAYDIAAKTSVNKNQQERFEQQAKNRMMMAKEKQDDENYKGWSKYLSDPNFSLHLMENIVNPTGEMRGIYEGVKRVGEGVVESTYGTAKGVASGEIKSLGQLSKQQLKAALDITIGAAHTYFSGSMLMQWGTAPIVPASFTIAGALAPGLTEKIMSPATTIARDVYGTDIENLSDTQKGFLELGDIIGMIVLFEGAKHSSKFVGKKISEIPIGDQTLIGKLGAVSQKIFNKEPLTESEIETTNETLKNTTDETIVEATKATIVSKDQAATGKIEVPKEEVKPIETKPVETTGGEKVATGVGVQAQEKVAEPVAETPVDEKAKNSTFDNFTKSVTQDKDSGIYTLSFSNDGDYVGRVNVLKKDNYFAIEYIDVAEKYQDKGYSKYLYKNAVEFAKENGLDGLLVGASQLRGYKSNSTYKNFVSTPTEIENIFGRKYDLILKEWKNPENDSQNITGIPSEIGKGQESVEAKPVAETPKTENVAQEALKDVESTAKALDGTEILNNVKFEKHNNNGITTIYATYDLTRSDTGSKISLQYATHDGINWNTLNGGYDDVPINTYKGKNIAAHIISRAYHEFGYVNPKFQKAVQDLLGKKEVGNDIPATTKVEPVEPAVKTATEKQIKNIALSSALKEFDDEQIKILKDIHDEGFSDMINLEINNVKQYENKNDFISAFKQELKMAENEKFKKANIEQNKEIRSEIFKSIVTESKSLDEAFKKAQEIKDVPAEESKAFREKYDPENNLTPKQAFEKFYNEVKGEKVETQKDVSKQNIDKFKEQMASGFEGIMDKIGGKKNITSVERTTLITDLKNIANGFIGLTFEEMRTALYEVVDKLKLKYRLKDKDVDEIVHGALEDFIVKDEATARAEVAKTLETNYANIEKKVFGTSTKTNKDFEGKTSIINKLLALPQQAQEKTFAKLYDFVGDKLAKVLAKGMGNEYSLIRSATKTTDSLFKNIARQRKDVTSQADFIGAKNRAVEDTIKIDYLLKKLLGDNAKESSERIIKVLDPEFYKKLEKDEFENEMRNEFTDKLVDERLAIEPDFLDKKYNEYLDEFGFNDPNYKDITFDDLNPTEQGVYQILKEINSFLHDVNFSVNEKINYKTYLMNKDKYFGRLYDKFEMPEDVQKELNGIGNKMFDDLYKERGDITTWKRSHRIQDPIYTTTKRLYQTQMNKAFTEYFDYVSKNPEYVSDVPRSGYITLKGKSYGELNGKHVRADVVEDIRGVFYTNDIIQKMHELFSKYNQIAPRRWYRKLFTVYNPGVHVGNLTGNVVFASWLGINPVRFLKDFTLAGKEIKNYGDTYRYLIKRGVLSSDLTIEDLGTSLKKLNDLFEESSTKINPLRWLSDKATTVYRATDDLAKVAAFKSLTDMGFSPDTAIERISQGFQNYKRVGKAYDFFSKVPAFGNMYAKFGGDLQRILKSGIMTRPLNFVAFGAALHGIANMASSLSGESDSDRKIREERPGFPKIKLPDWLGGDIPLSFKMGQNELNLARFISPVYVYSSPDNDDVYNTFMKLSPQKVDITDWTSNPKGLTAVNLAKNLQDPLAAPISQVILNSDFKGTPIADPKETNYKKSNLTDHERTVNSLRFLARSYLPYGSYADDGLRAIAGQQDYYGRDRTLSQIILRFVGYNAQQFKDDRYNKVVENDLTNKAYRIVDNAKILRSIEKDYINKEATEEQYKKRYAEKIEKQAILISDLKESIKKALPRLKKEGIDVLLEEKEVNTYFGNDKKGELEYIHNPEYKRQLPSDEVKPNKSYEIK